MLRAFMSYYKPYKRLFAFTLFCGILAGALELAFPLAVNQVIDNLLPSGNWTIILWSAVGLLALYIFNGGFHYVITYWGHKLGINIETDMRRELFDHIQKQSVQYFDNTKTGHLISRLTNDLMDIGEVAHHGPEEVAISIMTLLGAFGIMLSINWQLAVMTFVLVPFLIVFTYFFGKKMSVAMTWMFSSIADFNSRVENNVTGIRVVKAFVNEGHESEKFSHNNKGFRASKLKAYKIMAKYTASSQIVMKFLLIFVLLCGTWFVINGQLTYGEFVAFVLLANVMIGPINKLNAVMEMYPKGIAGFRRYLDLLNMKPEQEDNPNAIHVEKLKGDIEYKNVVFGYENKDKVLNGVNFSIRAGETVALVGPSGAGKTTICSLLPRFYEIDNGEISIDDYNIHDLTMASLREQIGVVQQDVFLFDASIRENIAYGKLDATDEEIWEAAERAQMTTIIKSLPEGLDTLIGERGVKLSGGQKQRLSIARMFLKNPAILILDEATSALDTETEAAIQSALAELAVGRTTIIIAHRLATIKEADRIFVVTENGIEEEGTHQELLQKKGAYSRLHHAQFDFDYAGA
ncbi:ABC transporter ATP-binding protein [Alkalicoccobacillus porphyridii]|uniref:ABC transporter ATP-binding protein n=1 Tax=Alkalicoccobacillus porphyridii TaxID=2597270 RepID=A0A554A0V0_9BACI|nr:ABC transporter ATP-binding protein [Alkalicoccobacillus porphyridii]TSB47319.1 ABC transporter ATP-binding protein [Alkalicoccobacillus porphyridii]